MPFVFARQQEVDEVRRGTGARARRPQRVGEAARTARDVEEDADDVVVLGAHRRERGLARRRVVGADGECRAREDELAGRRLVQAAADEDRAPRNECEVGLAFVELVEASDGADAEPVLAAAAPEAGAADGGGGGHPAGRRRRPAGRRWRWRPAGAAAEAGRGPP